MKVKSLIITASATVIAIASISVVTAVVIKNGNQVKDYSEYTTDENYTGTPLYDHVDDYNLVPFTYQLKSEYSSYEEVIAEKENLRKAKEEYYSYMLNFLAPIESVHGYELAKEMEQNSGYYTTAEELLNKLDEIAAKFTPKEETKISAIEKMLDAYINSQWDDETHDYSEKGVQCLAIREKYTNGEITLKEAMHETGFTEYLQNYRTNMSLYYDNYLSRYDVKTWFNLDDYI